MSSTLAAAAASATAGAASAPAWRHYPFFDVLPVKDVHDQQKSPEIFKVTPELSTTAPSSAGLLVADIYGSVHILDPDFVSITSWVAHVGGRVTHMAERKGVLVTLGEEDGVRSPLLKIWDIVHTDAKTSCPLLLRSAKILQSNRPHPVSTLALTSSLSYLAIGLGDGSVILYKHLDQSLANSSNLSALPKARTIHESPAEPVTGLGFKEPFEEDSTVALFIVTINRVLAFQVTGKGSGGTPVVVDEIGCGLGCATIDWLRKEMIVARDEAIFVCGTEGRGNCYAYEGHKSSIQTHSNYIIIVSPPFIPTPAAASATVRNFVAHRPSNAAESDITKITIFEPENKYVAYSGTFAHNVREVVSQWGQIYILTSDGNLQCLQEKSTATKLDMLYHKSLYSLALNLAKTQRLDDTSVADIHKQYGDHLYSKGEYDSAMIQFVQTIGHIQPSYVIRKFLDAQRIHNLVTYLQELHALGVANSDHTTLLLNAYTKLKDVSRLDSFIKTESTRKNAEGESEEPDELPFDLETAIRVCRQAGYFSHASYLAKKYERHEDYLRIQIEDAGNYADALAYLRELGGTATESNLARYGRAMLDNLPQETSQLLIDLCTGAGLLDPESNSKLLSPRIYFAHFVDHMPQFLLFLETIAWRRWGQSVDEETYPSVGSLPSQVQLLDEDDGKQDQVAVWNTLLELYLTLPGKLTNSSLVESTLRAKALRLLRSPDIPYDSMHALILCSTHQYTPGLVLLWEKLGMYEEILRFWMDKDQEHAAENQGESLKVIECLDHYGPENPHLYPLVLRFLTSSTDILQKHWEDVKRIIEECVDQKDGRSIMTPLAVVQILGRNDVASVGVVREWLIKRVKRSRDQVHNDQALTSSYRSETDAKLKQLEELSDPDHPRVFHITRCSTCGGQLDLPSIHFMCNHSYHQRCLVDRETECPNCAREHSVIREIRKSNERLANQHDVFLTEVKENGIAAIATAFGRGYLNMDPLQEAS